MTTPGADADGRRNSGQQNPPGHDGNAFGTRMIGDPSEPIDAQVTPLYAGGVIDVVATVAGQQQNDLELCFMRDALGLVAVIIAGAVESGFEAPCMTCWRLIGLRWLIFIE